MLCREFVKSAGWKEKHSRPKLMVIILSVLDQTDRVCCSSVLSVDGIFCDVASHVE